MWGSWTDRSGSTLTRILVLPFCYASILVFCLLSLCRSCSWTNRSGSTLEAAHYHFDNGEKTYFCSRYEGRCGTQSEYYQHLQCFWAHVALSIHSLHIGYHEQFIDLEVLSCRPLCSAVRSFLDHDWSFCGIQYRT